MGSRAITININTNFTLIKIKCLYFGKQLGSNVFAHNNSSIKTFLIKSRINNYGVES